MKGRVLHAPTNIAGIAGLLAASQRKLGWGVADKADLVVKLNGELVPALALQQSDQRREVRRHLRAWAV